MNLADVMDELGAALETLPGLRVYPYWVDRITPPAAVVQWPDPMRYDAALRRGGDRAEIPVTVSVGKVDARSARDELAAYADGAGARSVKAVIEAHPATAYGSARVDRADFGISVVAGVEYLAATFYIDIIGIGTGS